MTRSLSAAEVAALVEGELIGDGSVRLEGVAPLDGAGPDDLSFLTVGRYLPQFQASGAGAVLCTGEHRHATPGPAVRIVVKSPHLAMLRVVRALFPEPPRPTGIDPTAVVGRGAVLGQDVYLGPHVVVGAGARIGDRAVLMAQCVIGDGAVVGDDATLHPHVVLYAGMEVGARVLLHSGVRIGADGFGFTPGPRGIEKIPHVGFARIGDDVEIGANSCVDRGSLGDTIIGRGTKIDNLVQVGHNVRIGEHCLIMAGVGIGGSTVIGDQAILAGQSGFSGHFTVGKGARVSAQAGVIGDVPAGASVSGFPARPIREFMRATGAMYRLSEIVDELEALVKGGGSKAG